jgi:hypothetical protein
VTEETDDENEEFYEFFDDKDVESKNALIVNMRTHLNEKLSRIYSQQVPLRRLREEMSREFEDECVATIFMFGQKSNLDSVKSKFDELVAEKFIVDVALACELKGSESEFLCPGYVESLRNYSYSIFGGKIASNVLIKNPDIVQSVFGDGLRLCVYNTLQHYRSGTRVALNLNVDEELDNEEVESDLSIKFCNQLLRSTLFNIRSIKETLVNGIRNGTSIRFEVYCNINRRSIDDFCEDMLKTIDRNVFQLVSIDSVNLISFIETSSKMAQKLSVNTLNQISFTKWYSSFVIYEKWISYMFSLQKFNIHFLEKDPGFGLPGEWFDTELKLKKNGIEKFCGPTLSKMKRFIKDSYMEEFMVVSKLLSIMEFPSLSSIYLAGVGDSFET